MATEFAAEIKDLGDKIVNLTIKQGMDLQNYLKEVYGIEPAGGGAVMMAAPAAAPAEEAAAPAAPTSFKVILKTKGGSPIQVIKVVRAATNLGLKEAKELVDGAPKTVKEALPKEDAEKLVKELTEAGAEAEMAGM